MPHPAPVGETTPAFTVISWGMSVFHVTWLVMSLVSGGWTKPPSAENSTCALGSGVGKVAPPGTPWMDGDVHEFPVMRATGGEQGECAHRRQAEPLPNHIFSRSRRSLLSRTAVTGTWWLCVGPTFSAAWFSSPALRRAPGVKHKSISYARARCFK